MKFYVPKFKIATLQPPQQQLRSKFGGLPWGLPIEQWHRCQTCGRLMSLLAQLIHDPPALDLGGQECVLHLFQCQDCFGYEPGEGNGAAMISIKELGSELTPLPTDEVLSGVIASGIDTMVGELWIDGWTEQDDDLDPALAIELFEEEKWRKLPSAVMHSMFENRLRTKMGGIPYWTGNGPLHKPRPGYEFLFQLDTIEFNGTPPQPDDVGGMVVVTEMAGEGKTLRIVRQDIRKPHPTKKKLNAPWTIEVDISDPSKFLVDITNLGTDGTAYVFINRRSKPASVYWFWTR